MTPHPFPAQSASDAVFAAFTGGFGLTCIAIMLGCLIVLVFTARAAFRLRRLAPVHGNVPRNTRRPIWRDESGTATIEFVLLTPILLTLSLLLAQTTLAMGAQVFVNYAAFAAARTAMVQIPADYSDDEPNTITASDGSTKFDAIKQAAVIALLPIGGSIGSDGGTIGGGSSYNSAQIAGGLSRFYSSYGSTPPPWIDNFIANRVGYNAANTEVRLYKAVAPNSSTVDFQRISGSEMVLQKEAITVEVRHGFYLSMPYVRWFFSDAHGSNSQAAGTSDPKKTMTLSASSTLTVEGITDEMPPEPSLPRTPI